MPEDQKYWRYVLKKAETLLDYYGFERIDTSLLELSDLYLRAASQGVAIVEKEMFSLRIKPEENLSMKTDNRVSVARAYIENGMTSKPHPVKLFYVSPVFRNQDVQPGIHRQFHQLGVETIGDNSEIIDAELIFLAHKLLDNIGIDDYFVHINSVGDTSCKSTYGRALRDYYKSKLKKLCLNCRNNYKTNTLRILACKTKECQEINKEVPQFVDYLSDDCRLHFKHVLEFLDETKVPYILNPLLIRNRDYYNRTVFEFMPEQNITDSLSLVAGGRYDKLVETLGGAKTPAAGWSMGLDRVISLLKERNINVPDSRSKPKIFLVQLGEMAKRKSLVLFDNFRKAGIDAKSSLGRDSIKSQLRIAHRLGVKFALIYGQKEALDGTIILREMYTGIQETIPVEKILDEIKKRLKN